MRTIALILWAGLSFAQAPNIPNTDHATFRANLNSALGTLYNGKEGTITATTANDYYRGDKTFQNLPAAVRAVLSAVGPLSYNSSTGVFSLTLRSAGGLDTTGGQLGLLQGCLDGKILKYRTASGWGCEDDQGSSGGSGITSINGLTGSSQTLAAVSDTNITLNVGSTGVTHTYTAGWTGTLAKSRQHAATLYSDASYSDPTWLTLTWGGGRLTGIPSTFSPSAHASSHATAGSDPLSLNASQIGAGALAAARGGLGVDASGFTGVMKWTAGTPSIITGTAGFCIHVDGSIGACGTVNSVDLAAPSWLTVTGGPITSAGTLTIAAATGQTANRFLATPNGSTGVVGLRAIVAADLPTHAHTEADVTNLTTDLAAKISTSTKNQANGVAGLDGSARIANEQLPTQIQTGDAGTAGSYAMYPPSDATNYVAWMAPATRATPINFLLPDSSGSNTGFMFFASPSAGKSAGTLYPKDAANGVPTLDGSGKLNSSVFPNTIATGDGSVAGSVLLYPPSDATNYVGFVAPATRSAPLKIALPDSSGPTSGVLYVGAPSSGTSQSLLLATTGNSGVIATYSGSMTLGNCVEVGGSGNLVQSSGPCGSGGYPSAVTAKVYRSASLSSFTQDVDTFVSFDAEEWDTSSLHDNSTNPTRITIPASGYYTFEFYTDLSVSGTGAYGNLGIRKNGSTVLVRGSMYFDPSSDLEHVTLTVPASAGDYFEFFIHPKTTAQTPANGQYKTFVIVKRDF
jgi:hypothetical protein